MSEDPFLNETGRTNMGDLSKVKPSDVNIVNILGADGRVKNPSKNIKDKEEEAKKFAQLTVMQDGVTWHKDDGASEKEGRDMFFPRLSIKGLAEKFGGSRPHKQFFPEEKEMFLSAFMNDCAEYLFGVSVFNEISTSDGVAFRPNKEWQRLPIWTTKT